MLSNNRISFIKSLHQKKFRREEGLFLAEGDKLVREYLASEFEVVSIYADADWLRAHAELIGQGVETSGAKSQELERITTLVTAPPVIALVRIPETELSVEDCFSGLTLILDGIRDPGNLGTIIRTADWFGVKHIIASDDCAETWNPKVVQASMGSLTRVHVINVNLQTFFAELESASKVLKKDIPPVYGTFMDGHNVYTSDLTEHGMIVIGNEANGIREETVSRIDIRLGIPAFSDRGAQAESLNAGIATALVLSEFRRRKYQ